MSSKESVTITCYSTVEYASDGTIYLHQEDGTKLDARFINIEAYIKDLQDVIIALSEYKEEITRGY